jgi:hypothetical protein
MFVSRSFTLGVAAGCIGREDEDEDVIYKLRVEPAISFQATGANV